MRHIPVEGKGRAEESGRGVLRIGVIAWSCCLLGAVMGCRSPGEDALDGWCPLAGDVALVGREVSVEVGDGNVTEALTTISDECGLGIAIASDARELANEGRAKAGRLKGTLGAVLGRVLAPAGLRWQCVGSVIEVYPASCDAVTEVAWTYGSVSSGDSAENILWGGSMALVDSPRRADWRESESQGDIPPVVVGRIRRIVEESGPGGAVEVLADGRVRVIATRSQHRKICALLRGT